MHNHLVKQSFILSPLYELEFQLCLKSDAKGLVFALAALEA